MQSNLIAVNHKTLFDSPYDKSKESSFAFDLPKVNSLATEIIFANSSCYLVSGYRGAGKTSFVMKVQDTVHQKCAEAENRRRKEAEKNGESTKSDYELRFSKDKAGTEYIKEEDYEIVFIHLNFSKYDKETYLLRHLIRESCQQVDKVFTKWNIETGNKEEGTEPVGKENPGKFFLLRKALRGSKRLFQKEREVNPKIEEGTEKINFLREVARTTKELYQRTFLDVKTQIALKKEKTWNKETTMELDSKGILEAISLKKLLPLILLVIPITDSLNVLHHYWEPTIWLRIILWIMVAIISLLWYFIANTKLKHTSTADIAQSESSVAEELYDDEITAFKFKEILKTLKKCAIKLVFVLDELDKVYEGDVDKLLNEMKPFLLCGLADFIVIAGQELGYRYQQASKADDEIMSSLFSKFFHVPLKSTAYAKSFTINNVLLNYQSQTQQTKEDVDIIISYLLFQSKRVPRTYISKLRQRMVWRDNEAFLLVDPSQNHKNQSKILQIVDTICEKSIEPMEIDDVIKDYLISRLFSYALCIFEKKNVTQEEQLRILEVILTN